MAETATKNLDAWEERWQGEFLDTALEEVREAAKHLHGLAPRAKLDEADDVLEVLERALGDAAEALQRLRSVQP